MAYSNRRWGDKRSGGKGESMNRVSGRAAALRVGIGLLVLLRDGHCSVPEMVARMNRGLS
jgi:hypothetical protein